MSFLSRQKYACRDKTFVVTKLCLSRQICRDETLVAKNVLSQQAYVCRDKRRIFVATKMIPVAAPANDNLSHEN